MNVFQSQKDCLYPRIHFILYTAKRQNINASIVKEDTMLKSPHAHFAPAVNPPNQRYFTVKHLMPALITQTGQDKITIRASKVILLHLDRKYRLAYISRRFLLLFTFQPSQPAASSSTYVEEPARADVSGIDFPQCTKLCKYAVSALDYEDVDSAIDSLTKALSMLKAAKR